MLAVYVSGHGYGHATRTAEVLRVLRARAPELRIVVTTSAPPFLFDGVGAGSLQVRAQATDVGLVQKDALEIDADATVAAWRRFTAGWDERLEREARWLREVDARLVLGDIPPLAFAAAGRAGIPAVALGNFSWDWIYAHLAGQSAGLAEAASWARDAYRHADLLLRLPFAGDLSVFDCVEDVPFVARRPVVAKMEARRRLGMDGRPAILLSFGGIGLDGLAPTAFDELAAYQVLLSGRRGDGAAAWPSHVRQLEAGALAAAGVEYPDLVGAADIVVSKPGYGIVTDCIAAGTRLLYTDRGDFPEYPIMVAEMSGYLPAVYMTNDELRAGRLRHAAERVIAQSWPPAPDLSGAERVAERLVALLRDAQRRDAR